MEAVAGYFRQKQYEYFGTGGVVEEGAKYAKWGVAVVWDSNAVTCVEREVVIPGRVVRVRLRLNGDARMTGYDVFGVYMPTRGEERREIERVWGKLIARVAMARCPWVVGDMNAEVQDVVDEHGRVRGCRGGYVEQQLRLMMQCTWIRARTEGRVTHYKGGGIGPHHDAYGCITRHGHGENNEGDWARGSGS